MTSPTLPSWPGSTSTASEAEPGATGTALPEAASSTDNHDAAVIAALSSPDAVVEVLYGVFNDPDVYEPRFASGDLHPSLRQVILETPLYTDKSLRQATGHQRLVNEERRALGRVARDGRAVLRRQVIISSAWETVHVEDQETALAEPGIVPL